MTPIQAVVAGVLGLRASVTLNNINLSEWNGSPGTIGNGAVSLVGDRSATYEALYRTQPWVRAAVNRISGGIGSIPLQVFMEADDVRERQRDRSSSLVTLLGEPWPRATASKFKQTIALEMMLHGNCVMAKRRTSLADPPDWLIPRGSGTWTVVPGDDPLDPVEWYVWSSPRTGRRLPFLPSEVLHFSDIGPGIFAPSRMEALRRTLMIEDATQRAAIAAFEGGVRPRGAYSIDGVLKNRDALKSMRAQLDETYGGVDNWGKIMLLEGGAKWQEMSQSFVDMAFKEIRVLDREEVAAVFNIPQPSIGILDRATFSNIDTQHGMEYMDTLRPIGTTIEETIEAQLIGPEPAWAGRYVEMNYREILRGDPTKELETVTRAAGGPVLTRNEARARINLPPMKDDESADELLTPQNMDYGGSNGQREQSPAGPPMPPPEAPKAQDIHITMPAITVNHETKAGARTVTKRVQRDEAGRLTGVVESEEAE